MEKEMNITEEHIVEENTYIPETNIIYPEKPDEFIVIPNKIKDIDVENNYPFLNKSFKAKAWNLFTYFVIFILVFALNTCRYGLKIKGKKNLRKYKKYFKNGAITVCNHVYKWDYLAVLQAVKYRRMWFPARAANLETSDGILIQGAGGIPIPSSFSALKNFNKAFDELNSKKKWIHLFPESCRWDFYQPIRPFKIGAFKMALKYKVPIIPMVISYRKPTGIYKLLKTKHPLITLNIAEPILPEKYKDLSKNEAANVIRKECHATMVKMAGIIKNKWPAED